MENKNLLIALGGNAILQPGEKGTFDEQIKNIETACTQIAEVVKMGYRVIITHGNGPQVGNILIQNEVGSRHVPAMPLDVCGAQSQGMIGYMIQQSLKNILSESGTEHEIATVVTQVVVDKDDPAFKNPTKPVGPFYDKEKAHSSMREKGETWIEDSGRGWRRVVPSPDPKRIVEAKLIKKLFADGVVVVASGGGGVPVVVESQRQYRGIEAVIDKDLAGERLAVDVDADMFVILTDVPKVALNYRQDNELWLDSVTLDEAVRYQEEGHFKKGSMGPKVTACMRFVRETNKTAVISSLSTLVEAVEGTGGTRIIPLKGQDVGLAM